MQALVNELPDKTDQLGLKFISAFLNKISIATALVVPESVLLENNKLNQIKIVHKYQCKKNKRYADSNIGGKPSRQRHGAASLVTRIRD